MLAFAGIFDGTTLTINQTANDGDIVIANNGGNSAFRALDSSGFWNGVPATNVIVNLLPNTGNKLQFDLDNFHAGNAELNLGDGDRAVVFGGTSNLIAGNLTIMGGTGDQEVLFDVPIPLGVVGNAMINLSTGADNTVFSANANIAGTLSFVGVNAVVNQADLAVGQSLIVENTFDPLNGLFSNMGTMSIAGDFIFNGGSGLDVIDFTAIGSSQMIGGSFMLELGESTADGQGMTNFHLGSVVTDTVIGGNVSLTSRAQFNTTDFILFAQFGGDILVNLAESDVATNTVLVGETTAGTSIDYVGGNGPDALGIQFQSASTGAINASFGMGGDSFLFPSAAFGSMRADFGGGGQDSFSSYGDKLTFDAEFLNMNGFNHFYTATKDLWNIVQLADVGDITLDNNADGNAPQILNGNGAISELSPADNVRLNLLSYSSGDVTVDFDNAFAGDVLLDLFSGDRRVEFTGDDNSIGGSLRIFANDGDQYVDLAANSDLVVGENALITLRNGFDQVDDSGNNITVGNNLIMRRVNYFENDGVLTVGNNLTWNSASENVANTFDNDGTLDVGNQLYFKSGPGLDNVLLNHGVIIGGSAFVDVGDGPGTGPQNIFLTSGFSVGDRLKILGGVNALGNVLKMDSQTVVGGNLIVNFSNNLFANQAVLAGSYEGNYGVYRGGPAADAVTFRAQADDMRFVLQVEEGADTFTLDDETNLLSLFANFGADQDIDVFIDEFGSTYPFPVTLVNLP
jgi:hypothetical protein